MPIINAFPEVGGGSGNFGTSKILVETATREQRYSTSSSATVTNIGFVDCTTENKIILYGSYSNSTIANQSVVFYAIKDCDATIKYGSSASTGTTLSTVSLVAGHKYTAKRYAPSSSNGRYFKMTDDTTSTDVVNQMSSSNYWSINV